MSHIVFHEVAWRPAIMCFVARGIDRRANVRGPAARGQAALTAGLR